ncbi:MAG TPA: hypothetical protein VHM64_04705 [Candidatus Binatia bacterium]|nr:hypothetical protein [Candidatus Binatia bacterium]
MDSVITRGARAGGGRSSRCVDGLPCAMILLRSRSGGNLEVINIRSGPQTMAALVSGDLQIAYTIPGSVVSAAASGLDVAFFAGIVNKADGDFIAGRASAARKI